MGTKNDKQKDNIVLTKGEMRRRFRNALSLFTTHPEEIFGDEEDSGSEEESEEK